MRSYLSLVPIEARLHRKQNRLTVFCIALAVFLVTGVFSMADMAARMEDKRLRDKHGYWHIKVWDVSEEDVLLMQKDPAVKVMSKYEALDYDQEHADPIESEQVLVDGADENIQPVYYIRFHEGMGLKQRIASFVEKYGLTAENYSENAAILGIRGASSNSYIVGLYGVAAFLVLLVLLAGVLMIAGSMNSNIAERTQFFGMLRCIGASRQQIMHIVRREALNWCTIAIPIGEVSAILGTWGICAFLRYGIGGEFSEMPIGKISAIGLVCGALVGIITVLLAAHAPAKRAAKVSPVAAVSGSDNEGKRIKRAARTSMWRVDCALGIHHATVSKKNLVLMTGSFALSIILFLSFSVMIDWTGHALNNLKPYTPDASVADASYDNTITDDMIRQIKNIPQVKRAYGRMYECAPVETSKAVEKIDLISYETTQFEWSEDDLLCGDISKVKQECGTVMTVFDKSCPFELGDVIGIGGKEVEVAAILSDSPFSASDIPTVICSEKTFYELTGKREYAIVDIQLNKEADDRTISRIRSIFDDSYRLSDVRQINKEVKNTYNAFTFLVYSFLALIALITIFNIMNSISMSVSARIKQFGMMRAVGMDKKQIVKMIAGEAVTYGVCGCVAGCAIGVPINWFFFNQLITNYWGTPWYAPIKALGIIAGLTLLAAVIAVYRPTKRVNEMTITDTIHSL